MGVCISIVRGDNIFAPLAEFNGYAGNTVLFRALKDLPTTHLETGEIGDVIVRPTDFAPWRSFVASLGYNVEHFTAMLDRLEADPDLYLDFGY
jgi:hypothetical protein